MPKLKKKKARPIRTVSDDPERLKKTNPNTVSVSNPVPAKDVHPALRKPRTSRYDAVHEQLAKLKQGMSFLVTPPNGVAVRVLHNRLGSALRSGRTQPPEGCKFIKRAARSNEGKDVVAILCVKA